MCVWYDDSEKNEMRHLISDCSVLLFKVRLVGGLVDKKEIGVVWGWKIKSEKLREQQYQDKYALGLLAVRIA